jgi:hypothetical protein
LLEQTQTLYSNILNGPGMLAVIGEYGFHTSPFTLQTSKKGNKKTRLFSEHLFPFLVDLKHAQRYPPPFPGKNYTGFIGRINH